MPTFTNILTKYADLATRRENTDSKYEEIVQEFKKYPEFKESNEISVYVAGSIGRGEFGKKSDLDLFLIAERNNIKYLKNLELLSIVLKINQSLGYKEFSNDGQYLKIYPLNRILDTLGTPQDDSENMFTARMLLLLESRCVANETLYQQAVKEIVNHYFRDSRSKKSFRPLFLLNDMLRYWRTLCLNYELARDDPQMPFRKKNINLKFSRMLTVFGTVLAIISREPKITETEIIELTALSPHERFAQGLDHLNDSGLEQDYKEFLNDYKYYLEFKEKLIDEPDDSEKTKINEAAARFSRYIYTAINHKNILEPLRHFLVL